MAANRTSRPGFPANMRQPPLWRSGFGAGALACPRISGAAPRTLSPSNADPPTIFTMCRSVETRHLMIVGLLGKRVFFSPVTTDRAALQASIDA